MNPSTRFVRDQSDRAPSLELRPAPHPLLARPVVRGVLWTERGQSASDWLRGLEAGSRAHWGYPAATVTKIVELAEEARRGLAI